MKIKDIEKNLKKESETIKVPDVYNRARKAPINKLLSDPVHAFRSKMVMTMLIFVLLILLVALLGLGALWLTPSRVANEEYGYLRVSVGDDVYGFGLDKWGVVRVAATEQKDGSRVCYSFGSVVGKPIEEVVEEVVDVHDGDQIYVSVQYENLTTARTVSQNVQIRLESKASGVRVFRYIGDSSGKTAWTQYIAEYTAQDLSGLKLAELVNLYERVVAENAVDQ